MHEETNGYEGQNGTTEAAPPLPFDQPKGDRRPRKRRVAKAKIGPKGHLEPIVAQGRAEALAKGLTFGTRTLTAIENLAESWGVTPATVANVAIARGVNLLVDEDSARPTGTK